MVFANIKLTKMEGKEDFPSCKEYGRDNAFSCRAGGWEDLQALGLSCQGGDCYVGPY